MDPHWERDPLPTWVFTARRAEKVTLYRSTPLSQNGRLVLTPSPSGKTSLVYSLAGELGLDIYDVSLSSEGCVIGSPLHVLVNPRIEWTTTQ
jgi:hypothetical protein